MEITRTYEIQVGVDKDGNVHAAIRNPRGFGIITRSGPSADVTEALSKIAAKAGPGIQTKLDEMANPSPVIDDDDF